MMPFIHRIRQARLIANARLQCVWGKIERLMHSKTGLMTPASTKSRSLRSREKELERLDRLRNPGDYQGR